jgi:hypothetical protein
MTTPDPRDAFFLIVADIDAKTTKPTVNATSTMTQASRESGRLAVPLDDDL